MQGEAVVVGQLGSLTRGGGRGACEEGREGTGEVGGTQESKGVRGRCVGVGERVTQDKPVIIVTAHGN